jgi:uncharacterized membrane protein YdcZ (DUF606 family)
MVAIVSGLYPAIRAAYWIQLKPYDMSKFKVSVIIYLSGTLLFVKALILITTLEESYQTAHKTEIHFSFESQNMSFF